MSTTPSALPEALQARLLGAMQQASAEERECREMEQLLRRLRPADLPCRLAGRLGGQMYVEAQQSRQAPRRRSYWWRGSAAAAGLLGRNTPSKTHCLLMADYSSFEIKMPFSQISPC